MRVGIVSNSDVIIPLTYTLAVQKLQVYVFIDKSINAEKGLMLQAFSKQLGVDMLLENESSISLYEWINRETFDAVFVMGYASLINLSEISKSVQQRLFNIHFGPLPAYKGPSPVFWQLKHGAETLGVSIHRLTKKLDEGAVVWRKSYPNQECFYHDAAMKYLSGMSAEGVFFLLSILAAKHPILELSPLDVKPSYYKRPVAGDVLIDWQRMGALEIINLIKACNPWNKGAITLFKGNELKLMDARIGSTSAASGQPGEVAAIANDLCICTCDGMPMAINMLYYNDCYIPAYQAKYWGLVKGAILG